MGDNQQYFSEFGEILLYIIGGILFVAGALVTSWLLRPNRPNVEKLSTYESGEEPVGTGWIQFNIRFAKVRPRSRFLEIEAERGVAL